VIRQAISCDVCGSEKQQTNHWFVAHDQNGELRVTGWSNRNRMRPGTKHLCGQICLHKLVDEFMARIISVRLQGGATEDVGLHHLSAEIDATSNPPEAHVEVESSAHLVPAVAPVLPKRLPLRAPADLVAMPGRPGSNPPAPPAELPRYASRNWRAEAWDRERERELRAVERRPETSARRRSGS
jgi:hypothetical protein